MVFLFAFQPLHARKKVQVDTEKSILLSMTVWSSCYPVIYAYSSFSPDCLCAALESFLGKPDAFVCLVSGLSQAIFYSFLKKIPNLNNFFHVSF